MSELDIYLARHYQTAGQFAAHCGISLNQLNELIQQQLIPEPSYTVTARGTLVSYVFGEMAAPDATPGRFFHPANCSWVALALSSIEQGRSFEVKTRFLHNMGHELAQQNKHVFRLPDSFANDGSVLPDGLAARTELLWVHFLKGTFGLCIAHPATEAEIAQKEILQEKLSVLSEQGAKLHFSAAEKAEVLQLIEEFAAVSMPFSPIEYHRSSRKRFVEDLHNRLVQG